MYELNFTLLTFVIQNQNNDFEENYLHIPIIVHISA